MTTKLHTISRNWTETVIDGSDFLLSLPSDSNMDVVVSTTDTVQAPTSTIGHPVGYGLRNAITRELLGPGYVWAKSSGVCNVNLSTWSSDLAAILALGGLIGYWPTDPAYLYSDDAGTTLATVGGSVAYRENLVSGGPAAVQSTPANRPVLHKYSLSDFYWLETDDGSSTLTATTGDLGASCTVAYADANGAVFTEGVTISSTYSTTPAVGYNSDFMIFNRALTAAEKVLITRHLTRDRDFVQRELLAISGINGYWKADPQYLFEDSAGTTPASTNGTGPVGQWRAVNSTRSVGSEMAGTIPTPTIANNAGTVGTWDSGTNTMTNTGSAATGYPRFFFNLGIVVGSTYLVTGALTGAISKCTGIRLAQTGTANSVPYDSATGIFSGEVTAAYAHFEIDTSLIAGESLTISSLSIKPVTGNHAIQWTTANKPILRKTPTTNIYWADSNTSTSALNVALGNLGSACTVARSGAEGVTFTENVSITSTYNIAPAFAFNSDVAIFNRALTATEKALITRYMQRAVPMLGSNLVTNGTFDTDTAWTKSSGVTIENGTAVLTNVASNSGVYNASLPSQAGKYLLGKFDVVISAGTITHYNFNSGLITRSTSGSYSQVNVGHATTYATRQYAFSASAGTSATVDNMSSQEIL